ncbi:uncharacterized membrane protein [[Candida] railenensis]|uniref:Uncharacterized membrane protein n=1 Tax=[Candida] railenensis TaxID=45579 RepID=A0A9P0QRV0_9ASCO|nr:uncharacterized membrane protein [[Candida] railenensis]
MSNLVNANNSRANHIYGRSVALVVSIFVCLAAGTPYLYGVYGPQLIKQCGLTATDSATISLCTNIGAGFGGLPGGVIIDRFGPQLAILFGSVFITVGYFGVYRIYQAALSSLPLICIFMCIMGFGSITSYFATLKAAQANFPKHRGSAGAVPVSCYGLSATLLSIIAASYFNGNSGGFIGFLSIYCGGFTFIGSWFVHIYLDEEDADKSLQHSPSISSQFLNNENAIDSTNDEEAVLLLSRDNSGSNLKDMVTNNTGGNPGGASSVTDTLGPVPDNTVPPPPPERSNSLHGSFSFWGIGSRTPRSSAASISSSQAPLINSLRDSYENSQSSRAPAMSKQQSLASLNSTSTALGVSKRPTPKSSLQIVVELLKNKNFIVHYSIVSVLSGIGQMYIYTVGFIVIAQYYYGKEPGSNESIDTDSHQIIRRLLQKMSGGAPPGSDKMAAALQALQVSVISISSFSGRLIAGVLSDFIHKRYHIQRLWIVLVTIIFFSGGQLLIMNLQRADLIIIPSIIVGASYGLIFGTYPAVIADEFGTKTFSTTWGLICTGPLITLFILNKYFGMIYDHNTDPGTGICYKGNDCYRGAFELSFGLCLLFFAVTLCVIYVKRKP